MRLLALLPALALALAACTDSQVPSEPREAESSGTPTFTVIGGSPLDVDSDGALPIDFEPITNLEPIRSFGFDIDSDGNLETLSFSRDGGIPVAWSLGPFPGLPAATKSLSSLPNTTRSLTTYVDVGEPVRTFSFDLLDPQYVTAEVMAQLAGLDPSMSSLGDVIEALDSQSQRVGTVVRAFDNLGRPVALGFEVTDYDPALPSDANGSQVSDLSSQGGPVSALSIPGDGSYGGFTATRPMTTLRVAISAAHPALISRVAISSAMPCTTGVPCSGDFIVFDNLDFPASIADFEGPLVTASIDPVPIGSGAVFSADVDDTETGGSPIASAEYRLDQGSWIALTPDDGSFDEVHERVSGSLGPSNEPSVSELCFRGTDAAGFQGSEECFALVIYDPSGGHVTGGGWIWSPRGALRWDWRMEGKANFGFFSKYKKGANAPHGNTHFFFKAADFKFESDSYDWLVVNQGGSRAQYKGSGFVNGETAPNGQLYRFTLWAEEDPDIFRIKIWWELEGSGDEVLVYDNGGSQLGGGSIVVHTK